MIVRARSVVTMDGEPISDGAVVIAGEKITDVGRWKEVRARNAGKVIDVGECALMPGLINLHCHLDYTDLRGRLPRGAAFTEWIRAINEGKAAWSDADYVRSIQSGFAEAAHFGTTTIVNLTARPDLLGRMEPAGLRTWWCAEMIDVRQPVSAAKVCANLESSCERGGWLGGIGLAPHAPYTASLRLYSEAAALGRERDVVLTTHLAESSEEKAMFWDGRGALFDFLQSIGRSMEDCGSCTPVELLTRAATLDERWIVAHLNELTESDVQLLARGPKFHIAHCPRSHGYFGHSPFESRRLRALGFNICLGTDSLASNEDLSLFAEMRQFAKNEPSLSARELLEMVTVHAAFALRQRDALGKLRAGFLADLIAIPCSEGHADPYEKIVAFNGVVSWMVVGGNPISAP